MSQKLCLSVILTVTLLLAACAPTATPTTATTAPVQPTTVPTATAVLIQPTAAPTATTANLTTNDVQPDGPSIKVGLVTDIGGVNDKAFNQLAWAGIRKASEEMGFQAKFIESRQPTDYETNINALATEDYNVIVTVGFLMSDATALKAKQYPNIKFAIVDNAYTPTSGSQYCADNVIDCYSDGGLTNVSSLMFAEDQLGFLAGILAGGMSRSGFVCSISSMKTPASDRYVVSFFGGAIWQGGGNIRSINNYINIQTTNDDIPNFIDPTQGKETALNLIREGCDVVFGVAANGALLAARENNLMAIGADVDQYQTYPEAKEALMSSAQKNVDVAVYNYLKTIIDGSVKAGITTGNLQNGSVGLAPFHDWDGKIPDDLKAQIQKASDGIMDGSIKIDPPLVE